jgi:hypothetical protein
MPNPKTFAAQGADWTQLLSDPDLIGHLGKLLQTYREAPPENRDEALLKLMREIKSRAAQQGPSASMSEPAAPVSTPAGSTPPFEPDIFTPTPNWGQDRRRYPRMKCFVAVEVKPEGAAAPIWGNLSNTSLGGCFVETASPIPTGVNVEIGLWVANGKIWVKGMILTGTVTQSNPCFGVRIRFGSLEIAERETLREFLKFVEVTTRGYQKQNGYLAQMKR